MNLYRNFGNLLETWVTDGVPFAFSDEQALTWSDASSNATATPVSDPGGLHLRSGSDDSGFEITTSSSDAAEELNPVSAPTDREERSPTPGSTFTSSSPPLRSSARSTVSSSSVTRRRPMTMHHKLEQALLKIDRRVVPKSASTLPRRATPAAVRVVRSESVRETPDRPRADRQRLTASFYQDLWLTETHVEEESEEARGGALGPGLSYLEQVCQMWEEVARLQMDNRELRAEMGALTDAWDTQPESRLCSCDSILKDRHRTTNTLTRHLRSLKPDTRGQQTNPAEEDQSQVTKGEKKGKTWTLRKAPFRKEAASVDSDGHQSRPAARRTTSHRLRQLFHGTRRTFQPS